ncbi:MAG: glutathione-disulfide reductase [Sphingopyxis sp.]|nr:glutathione-disulfide reductase [Sphingopyxis sp.]
MTNYDFDLFVIGAGSGGFRAARASAAHGARVAIAEEYRVGGTCVIRGCVPKKMLFYGAQFAEDLHDARRFGWRIGDASFDWKELCKNVLDDVDRLNGLYQQTLDNNQVATFHERAKIVGPHQVALADGRLVSAGLILVATGATPLLPTFEGAEYGITSNEAFHLEELPRNIVIAGSGYIANEFAGIFNSLGSTVTIVNRSERMLAGFDGQIRDRLLEINRENGISYRFNARFDRVTRDAAGELVVYLDDGAAAIACDTLLFAIGRVPNSRGVGLEDVGVDLDEAGAVRIDGHGQTSVPSIWAIGDVTNRIQLTPVAIREGQAFADTRFGGQPHVVDYDYVPSAAFSHPPLASVGLTEEGARSELGALTIHVSDFRPMKNVLAGRNERALYKMICEEKTGRVVGLHMIGPEAPELLQVAAVAIKAGLTKQDFDNVVALHPTMAEELVLMR